jgi:predicted dehydrogenase
MRSISVVLVGLGRIGFDYGKDKSLTHYYSCLKFKKFNISFLVDSNIAIKNKLSKSKKKIFYSQISKIPKKSKIEIVIISSSDESHFSNIMEILEYKPKLIIIEKPVAKKTIEILKIKDLLRKNKVKLIVNYSRRFNNEFIKLKRQLVNNYFGKIKCVKMSYSRGLFHNSVHLLDLSFWLFGKPKKFYFFNKKKSSSFKDDLSSDVILDYNFFYVYILSYDINNHGNEEIDIVGSKKRVSIDYNMNINYYDLSSHNIFKNTKKFKLFKKKKIIFKSNIKNLYNQSLKYFKDSFYFHDTFLSSLTIQNMLGKCKNL